mmetsp:Transcript_20681/g.50613  ORF Transcript_20681/g.50613 Transcript_20681/m.50613 type:complete len:229 (+) Transcript_20681:273-959(+)
MLCLEVGPRHVAIRVLRGGGECVHEKVPGQAEVTVSGLQDGPWLQNIRRVAHDGVCLTVHPSRGRHADSPSLHLRPKPPDVRVVGVGGHGALHNIPGSEKVADRCLHLGKLNIALPVGARAQRLGKKRPRDGVVGGGGLVSRLAHQRVGAGRAEAQRRVLRVRRGEARRRGRRCRRRGRGRRRHEWTSAACRRARGAGGGREDKGHGEGPRELDAMCVAGLGTSGKCG